MVGTTTVVGTVTVLGAGQLGTTVFMPHEVTVEVLYTVGHVLVVVVVVLDDVQSFQPLVEVVVTGFVEVVLLDGFHEVVVEVVELEDVEFHWDHPPF